MRVLGLLREQEHDRESSASSTAGDEVQSNNEEDEDHDSDKEDSSQGTDEGSYVLVDQGLQEEAVASVEVEHEEVAHGEANGNVEDGIDEDVMDSVDEETQDDADLLGCDDDSDLDILEDDTLASDSSSESGSDTGSEYSPSPSECDTTLEYRQFRVSKREQNSILRLPQHRSSDTEENDRHEQEANEDSGQHQSPDTEDDDRLGSDVNEDPDFEGFVIPDRESFETFVSLFTTPSVTAQSNGGQPDVAVSEEAPAQQYQADEAGEAHLGTNIPLDPIYYANDGAYESGFGPEAGYASNACGYDMDMMDVCGIFGGEDYNVDRMDTSPD